MKVLAERGDTLAAGFVSDRAFIGQTVFRGLVGMKLSDLSAQELARIDAICLDFESRLRDGSDEAIDEIVTRLGGDSAGLLRQELEAVRAEVETSRRGETLFAPFGFSEVAGDRSTPSDGSPLSSVGPEAPAAWGRVSRPPGASPDALGRTTSGASGPDPGGSVGAGVVPASVIHLPEEGDVMGPYRIGGCVGRGGMGAVYEAIDLRLDRKVAVKVLAVAGDRQRELTERFEREAKAVASLSHPNIVELFDVGVVTGVPYAVMEFLKGETLEDRLRRGRMEPAEVRQLGVQICGALAAAHAAGVIHRDLKPQNIMLMPRVKLFDFGLSRAPRSGFDLDPSDIGGEGDSKTRTGMILGTPGYLSPEQARGETVTPAADLFGLGCVLHEAFYGSRAFDGPTPAERFAAVLRAEPTRPSDGRRAEDPELAALIDRCLAKDPSARPRSAEEIAEGLRETPSTIGPGGRGSVATGGARADDRGDVRGRRPTARRVIGRRSFFEAAAGGIGGLAFGGWAQRWAPDDIREIRSLGVLSLVGDPSEGEPSPPDGPAGNRSLSPGELLAGMIVHELSRSEVVTVPKFVPRTASTPAEFRRIAAELGVDALLKGSYHPMPSGQGGDDHVAFDLQIVAAKTGKAIWRKSVVVNGGDDFFRQTAVAGKIAEAIGCTLVTSAACDEEPAGDAFKCLVRGRTYADPDSVDGLLRALACFEHASQEDPRLAASHAGVALTSLTLAARSPGPQATGHVETARAALDEALRLSDVAIDARLARAMLQWQILYRHGEAFRELRELSMVATNHWQVHHQFGLLLLVLDQLPPAAESLRLARRLHPASLFLKVEHLRAEWFLGERERAVLEAEVLRDDSGGSPLVRGLLVDIHEQNRRWDLAAAEHDDFRWEGERSAAAYFRERSRHLETLPYGPFGPELNQTIFDVRAGNLRGDQAPTSPGKTFAGDDRPDGEDRSADKRLIRLRNAPALMLPLLLARHPAMGGLAGKAAAAEVLPDRNLVRSIAAHPVT